MEARRPGDGQPMGAEDQAQGTTRTPSQIATILQGYLTEAREGRTERDRVWQGQWDLYWQNMDFSQKAPWQSQVVMPQGPQFIERFAAAMKQALMQAGKEWYTIDAPPGMSRELLPAVKLILDYWLDRAGMTATTPALGFPVVFEDAMKMAAISKFEIAVTSKDLQVIAPKVQRTEEPPMMLGDEPTVTQQVVHVETTRTIVDIEAVEPLTVWRDPRGRGMYRLRLIEMDLYQLKALAQQTDAQGNDIWFADEIAKLTAATDPELDAQRNRKSGGDPVVNGMPGRKTVMLHEFYGDLVDEQGELVMRNCLAYLANENFCVRGPEPCPYWHGQDPLIGGAVIRVKDSTYGKSYVESWASLAVTFTEMSNLIFDATYMATMKAFAGDITVLENPEQMREGVHPNKFFQLEAGRKLEDFMAGLDLGRLPKESFDVWNGTKDLLQEGAMLNDILLGNIPDKGDVKATEVMQASKSGAAFMQSIAQTVQLTCLEPVLNLVWKTALQVTDFNVETELRDALGEVGVKLAAMTPEERLRMIGGPYTFTVRGLSAVMERQEKIQRLLAALSQIFGNQALAQAFMQRFDISALPEKILTAFGVDASELPPPAPPPQPQPQPQAPPAEPGAPPGQAPEQGPVPVDVAPPPGGVQ